MKYISLFLLLIPNWVIGQKTFTVSGYVYENPSKELLTGVNVFSPALKQGTSSNAFGFYSITIPQGNHELIWSFVGFESQRRSFFLNKDTTINIYLSSETLEEVVVNADREDAISQNTKMSRLEIPIEQIKQIPALFGEKDVLKVLQLMPGVQSGSEGQAGLYVRGGGPDQNLIILDDATVYNAFHLFGFFSLFNGDALKSVELIKGGFPARYGGRLSSVLDMRMKDGNKEKFTGEAGIGLIASRITLEGPIIKGKSSFIVSARRTYIDILTQPFILAATGGQNTGGYFFWDGTAKANYEFSQKDRLYISSYFGKDRFYFRERFAGNEFKGGFEWGNATATARWNHLFSNKLFSNLSLIFTQYQFQIDASERVANDEIKLNFSSNIRDFGVKYDFDYLPHPNHKIKFGLASTLHRFTPSAIVFKADFAGINQNQKSGYDALESGIYIEDDWKINNRFKANLGFRLSHYLQNGKNYINPEPRIGLAYFLSSDIAIKASYASMNQYIHLLSNTGINLPTDLWVGSTSRVAPQNSNQAALGIAKDFFDQGLAFSVEGYYKKSNNVISYKEGASFLIIDDPGSGESAKDWQDNITVGQGWAYGLELLLQKKRGDFTGWVGYTLSWTQLQFDDINFGQRFNARYDRRHDISVVGMYKINEKFRLSATWVYGTGQAISLPNATYDAGIHYPGGGPNNFSFFNITQYSAPRNGLRMAPYHRADVGLQYTKKKKWGEATWEFSVYNLYNRWNPYFYFIRQDFQNPEKSTLRQVSLFGFLPSITYNIKF